MVEFAKFIQVYVGLPVVILFFGMLSDYLSSPSLKAEIIKWIGQTERIRINKVTVSSVLTAFLNGFLYRIFSAELFSLKFFLRSSCVFLVFLIFAFTLQGIFYNDFFEEVKISTLPSVFVIFVVSILFVNAVIDYISNIFSLSLLRMVAASGRVLDVVVAFFADLALTVTLFTILFPVALVVGIFSTEAVRPPADMQLSVNDKSRLSFASLTLKMQPDLKFSTLQLRPIKNGKVDEGAFSRSGVLTNLDSSDQLLKDYIEIAETKKRRFLVGQRDEQGVHVTVQIPPLPFELVVWKAIYYLAFREANVTRDAFLEVVTLDTKQIELSSIFYNLQHAFSHQKPYNLTVKCVGGEIKNLVDGDDLPCRIQTGVFQSTDPELFASERMMATAYDHIPISPFFFTSFALSLLFYFAILIVGIGVVVLRLIGTVFSTSYFQTERPFSLLSFIVFCLVEVVIIAVHNIF